MNFLKNSHRQKNPFFLLRLITVATEDALKKRVWVERPSGKSYGFYNTLQKKFIAVAKNLNNLFDVELKNGCRLF